ncbi:MULTISPECIES: hypothetical protein [Amycolatopsis]|nr:MULTISPECIES: hypothetical protein [Amycolatopsis]
MDSPRPAAVVGRAATSMYELVPGYFRQACHLKADALLRTRKNW